MRSIFVAKCSECHGRGLSRPRAALYLHELGPLAANPEWVVPHEPEKSYLWTLIRDDDMPAKGAKAGPLNAEEKEIIRAWIAAGAPVPKSSPVLLSSPGRPARIHWHCHVSAGIGATIYDDPLLRMVRQISCRRDSFSHRTLGGGGTRGSHRGMARLMDAIADGAFLRPSGSGQCHDGSGAGLAPRRCRWFRWREHEHPRGTPLARNRGGLRRDSDCLDVRARESLRPAKHVSSRRFVARRLCHGRHGPFRRAYGPRE